MSIFGATRTAPLVGRSLPLRLPRGARYEKCRRREIFLQATADNLRDWHNVLIAHDVAIACRSLMNS